MFKYINDNYVLFYSHTLFVILLGCSMCEIDFNFMECMKFMLKYLCKFHYVIYNVIPINSSIILLEESWLDPII